MNRRIGPESVRAQLSRILGSRAFARTERLARFLRFTVEQMLGGNADQLKEFVVGVEVFDKGDNYDPRTDPIVRVEARRLRQKLTKYYESEGRADPLVIEFPKGGYAPVVRAAETTAASPASAGPRRGIAVLPFVNLSPDADNDYISDGLTEELINALTKVDDLRVVAWSSAVRLKGKARDVARIGAQLNVDTILEGSVRASPGRLRITAQLVDVRDGSYLWSETFERACKDVFAMQDEISRAIVKTLRGKLGGPKAASARRTEHLEAYHLYLKGRFYWNQRSEDAVSRGIDYFEQAVVIDPDYAPAYAGLADSYIVLGKFGMAPAGDVMPKAKSAAERALEIDPTLAEAHVSLGSVVGGYEWDWARAEQHYRKALELNPSYATAHHWYAYDLLAPLGRLEEAERELRRARDCDPLSLVITTSAGEILSFLRQPERALELYHNAVDVEPNWARVYISVGRAYLHLGRHDCALEALRRARSLSPQSSVPIAVLAHATAVAGRSEEARALVAQLERMARERYIAPYLFMRAWMGLDLNRAFDFLIRAVEERDPRLVHLNVSPIYDTLRTDPRFRALVEKMGLAACGAVAAG